MAPSKITRKPSLYSRIKSYPFDLLLSINEQRELIDWDAYASSFALPLGYGLTFLFFICMLWRGIQVRDTESEFFDFDDFQGGFHGRLADKNDTPSFLTRFVDMIVIILWSTCIANSYLFFSRTRSYYIYNKDLDSNSSSSLTRVERSKSFLENVKEYFNMVRSSRNVDSYWELRIWDPSKFSTYLFISFSPLCLLYLHISTSSTFSSFIYVLIFSFNLHYLIIFKFTQLIQDKKTLFEETMDEYQKKFVNPRLSTQKKSVGIDATKGPYSDAFIEIQNPRKVEKVFKTHDFNGKEVTELFNDDTGEFEVVNNLSRSTRGKRMMSPVKIGFNGR